MLKINSFEVQNLHKLSGDQIVCCTFKYWQESRELMGLHNVLFKHVTHPLVTQASSNRQHSPWCYRQLESNHDVYDLTDPQKKIDIYISVLRMKRRRKTRSQVSLLVLFWRVLGQIYSERKRINIITDNFMNWSAGNDWLIHIQMKSNNNTRGLHSALISLFS